MSNRRGQSCRVSYVRFCFPACRGRVSGYGIRHVSTCRVYVGMGFASRVRLGLFVPCSGVGGGLRSCPGYAKKGGGTLVVSPPCEVWVRRRATLPHPLECSTIAVPGLSFRVRKGTGRLTWAMTTAKPIQRPTTRIGRRNRNHATIPIVAVREPDNGREQPNASPVSFP